MSSRGHLSLFGTHQSCRDPLDRQRQIDMNTKRRPALRVPAAARCTACDRRARNCICPDGPDPEQEDA